MRRIVKPFDWVVALFCVPALGLMLLALVNPRGYSAGLANTDPPFFFMEGFLFVAGAILELVGIVWVLAMWGRSSKATRIFGCVVAGVPLVIAVLLILMPLHMYRRGFARWAAARMNPEAIRAWYAGGRAGAPPSEISPFDGAMEVALANCPPEISMSTPGRVLVAPAGRGVFLEWGTPAEWPSTRHLYIGIDAREPAPPEIGGWTQALPGMYVTDR